jgi:hypothetical protein
LKTGRGQNIKYRPFAFTEHGAIQAANVLNSPRAIAMGVYVVRAFVRLRDLLTSNTALARKPMSSSASTNTMTMPSRPSSQPSAS